MNLQTLLDASSFRLAQLSETPALDAQVLLAHCVGRPRTWVLAHPEEEPSLEQEERIERKLCRLEAGEPLPYVLGHWEFFGLDFILTPDVLIPRPETELLIEKSLDWLNKNPKRRRAIDVGTGSGCIAITLAKHIAKLKVAATDISAPALEIAQKNAQIHDVSKRIDFHQCDVFPEAHEQNQYDLVVGNLPYIPTATVKGLKIYGKEPTLALDGGSDGLDVIRRLLTLVPQYLVPGGLILLEIESGQGMQALSLAFDAVTHATINLYQDYTGRDRLLEIQTF